MLCRTHISGFAKFVLAALLFAQAALAVSGCDLGQRSAAQAIASMGEALCPEHGESGILDGNANLCLAHCTSDAQNVDTAGLAFHSLSAAAVLSVSPALAPAYVAPRRPAALNYAFAAPPVRILTHNFRI